MGIRKLLIILVTVALFGCATATNQMQDAAAKPDTKKTVALQPLLPPPPPIHEDKILKEDPLADVYISMDAVDETLSSILYMISAEAGLNLIISPDLNVSKPFTLTINNMPARDALDTIAENTGIYYEIKGNSLKILSSVTKTFKFPYVKMSTTQKSEIGGDVFGASEANLRGDYSIKYENNPAGNDVQTQIISGIHAIIFPDTADTGVETSVAGEASGTGEATSTATASTGGSSSGSDSGNGYFKGTEGYIYNRFTGVLKVTTTPSKMKMVEGYMEDVLSELKKQVLIEAKLVEVVLNDSSAYGINWRGAIDSGTGALSLGTAGGTALLAGGLTPVGVIASGSADDWFSFMATQGRVESMGNPRIRVMNGQSAMISSGQLIPYWEMDKQTDTETKQITVNYTRVTVLDGVVLGVTAHVKEDKTITLNIVPVFSDVETVKTLVNEAGEIVASYPVVNLKEAGTVLNVPSGQTIIMGGLISNVETEKEDKIPLLGDIPVLGYLFKGKSKVIEKRELVIFLTTTILDGQP